MKTFTGTIKKTRKTTIRYEVTCFCGNKLISDYWSIPCYNCGRYYAPDAQKKEMKYLGFGCSNCNFKYYDSVLEYVYDEANGTKDRLCRECYDRKLRGHERQVRLLNKAKLVGGKNDKRNTSSNKCKSN